LGYIPPGTSITEKQIEDVLKVSSSPIREALIQLEAEGLLTRSPHVGTRVAEIVVEDASELYSIQALLQSSAVQICTRKLSETNIRDAEKLNNQIEDIVSSGNVDVNAVKILVTVHGVTRPARASSAVLAQGAVPGQPPRVVRPRRPG